MRIPSPDAVFERLIAALPKGISDLVWNVTYLLAWVTLPVSFISNLSDLQILVSWLQWFVSQSGALASLLLDIGETLVAIIRQWRSLVTPLHNWLEQTLTFEIAPQVTEILLAALPTIPSIARLVFARRTHVTASATLAAAERRVHRKGVDAAILRDDSVGAEAMEALKEQVTLNRLRRDSAAGFVDVAKKRYRASRLLVIFALALLAVSMALELLELVLEQ